MQSHDEQQVRTEVALALYDKMILTRTEAQAMMGIDEDAFFRLTDERGMKPYYDVEDFELDLANLKKLGFL